MKKVSSVVWQFFDRLEENKRCVAVLCKLCDSEYKYFGNTTNLRAHLIKKHPIQWEFRQNKVYNNSENNLDNNKTLEEAVVHAYEEDDNTNHSTKSPKRRKYVRATAKDQNVRYALSIKNIDSDTAGEDAVPQIEIQRVDVRDNSETENEHVDEDVTTLNLVRQMHDNQGSDEEWLEDDYIQLDRYEPAKRKRSYKKIKREVVTPPRRTPTYHMQSATKTPRRTERIVIEDPKKDEYSVFGEYIANKLRKFKAPRTRGNIQQIITTILWQAEYGLYDDAEAVKRVLMLSATQFEEEQQNTSQENDTHMQTEQYTELMDKSHEGDVQTIQSG